MNEPEDIAVKGVDFVWQPIDFGSQKNPEILLTGVPEGTKRFLVNLETSNNFTFVDGMAYGVFIKAQVFYAVTSLDNGQRRPD